MIALGIIGVGLLIAVVGYGLDRENVLGVTALGRLIAIGGLILLLFTGFR